MRKTSAAFCLMGTLLLVLGCGGGNVKPSGKIVKNGQPFTLSEQGVFVVALYDEDDKKGTNPFAASTKPDGTFTVTGKDGKGIPPGKYRVAVEAFDPYPDNDLLAGKFKPENTNLTVEVASGKELVVDVAK